MRFLIIFVFFPVFVYSMPMQLDSIPTSIDTCLSPAEIINIAKHIQDLENSNALLVDLNAKYKERIEIYNSRSRLDSIILSTQNQEITYLSSQVYRLSEQKDPWYKSNTAHFVYGILVVLGSAWAVGYITN